MQNLAMLVDRESVLNAIDYIDRYNPKLAAATKFHVHYNGREYPPKELVRYAAGLQGIKDLSRYRLAGGPSTNNYLQKMGFDVRKFRDWNMQPPTPKNKNQKRIARICWNREGWISPTGPIGKSKDSDSHEFNFGYGHEEWLFDLSKLIDGYHYSFLEPVRKQRNAYTNRVFDVWLYTIDGQTRMRYWLGEIKNLIVIDETEAESVKQHYGDQGWISEMEKQIRLSEANPTGFSDWKGIDIFNVKFRIKDVYFKDYIEIPTWNPILSLSRYSFTHFRPEFAISDSGLATGFKFIAPSKIFKDTMDILPNYIQRKPKAVEISNLHRNISQRLVAVLRNIYGTKNVTSEHPSGFRAGRIDIVVNNKGKYVFYEIKTYATIETSIREALGQILEYSLCPDRFNASELIIVTQEHNDDELPKVYFPHLRKTLKIPIYFQFFNTATDVLSEKY